MATGSNSYYEYEKKNKENDVMINIETDPCIVRLSLMYENWINYL